MRLRIDRKYLLCFLCILLWFFSGISPVLGVRVAGENGVTSVIPEQEAKPSKSNAGDQPEKRPSDRKPGGISESEVKQMQGSGDSKEVENKNRDNNYVTIDFDDVDIAVFIKFISELTGTNFVIDKAVSGKVTIVSPTRISVEEAYKVFESVLEVHGYAAVQSGNIVKIVPAIQASTKSIETRLSESSIIPEDRVVTQLIPLRYAEPEDLQKVFTPLVSKSSVIVSYPPTGTLIVTDVLSNIKRLLKIVKVIDVEGIGAEISVVPLKYATASVIAKSIESLFEKKVRRSRPGVPVESVIKIAADERTNVLIILASEDDTVKIKQLIELLDKETPRGTGDIHVYYLQNGNAEDMAKVLTAIPSKQSKSPQTDKGVAISQEVQIVADKATNSLVITASKDDYLVLEDVIKKLDIPRAMVYIEALIMEVNVDKEFDLGVEWQGIGEFGSYRDRKFGAFGGSLSGGSSGFPGVSSTTGMASLATGLSLGVLGEGITIGGITFPTTGAVIRAYQTDTDVHIVSTPQIMTTDNEEAQITVGKNVPYQTRADTSSANVDYSTYEYKDVGVTLKITPQINQERFVRLKIFQEVTRLIQSDSLKEGRPTTYKRSAETTVIIKDANTVVIGGLIGDETTNTGYMVPCLGNVPGLGWFFKSDSATNNRTNLFVFLTPHIIENPREAEDVYHEKNDEINRVKEGVIKMHEKPQAKVRNLED
ncbi:MAG TPA: type II secretion system secretin GspD [Desulfobacteraceae bacterium]|nr:type II secretion system secretin GspD [Desulfobacteraceae bacterium]HPJ68797.1 type II secretion system secretin GspD [Desulfobacteraceae bacterium]HPQ27640.1 type II secretion system secretin GspD [Desulfobacteraceae bacterium]